MISMPASYEASRGGFRASLTAVQRFWPGARLDQHTLAGGEGLSIDWISADALEQKEKVIILTAGEHGIEAYAGTALMQLFIEE